MGALIQHTNITIILTPSTPSTTSTTTTTTTTGMYIVFIEKWLEHFQANQFLILNLADFDSDPKYYYETIFNFLGLSNIGDDNLWNRIVSGSKSNVNNNRREVM